MRRSDFLRDRRRFCSRRRARDARVGLLGMRGLSRRFNPMSIRRRRWRARSLLRPWRRCSDATTVIPVGKCTSLTALSTLLRCWPPGPPPRKGWNRDSSHHPVQPIGIHASIPKYIRCYNHVAGACIQISAGVFRPDAAADPEPAGIGGQRGQRGRLVARSQHDDVTSRQVVRPVHPRVVGRQPA